MSAATAATAAAATATAHAVVVVVVVAPGSLVRDDHLLRGCCCTKRCFQKPVSLPLSLSLSFSPFFRAHLLFFRA